MNRAWVALSVLLSAVSLGVAVYALDAAREARRPAPVEAQAAREEREALVARLDRIEERANHRQAVPASMPSAADASDAPGSDASRTSAAPGSPDDPARAALEGPPPEEGIRALVRQTVKEEMEARKKEAGAEKRPAPGEGRKPPLSQVAAELDLDDAQRESVHQAVLHGQEETIALLRTPTAGGRVPLEDLMKAFMEKPEKVQGSVIEVFGMLATEKVPGSEETYAQRVDGVKKAAADAFRRSFTPEQYRAYEKTGQDPLEIQVPDSPWIQVLQEAWKRKQ